MLLRGDPPPVEESAGGALPPVDEGAGGASAPASEISIESFDDPSMTWSSLNDLVMGGESTGAVRIEDGIGTFGG